MASRDPQGLRLDYLTPPVGAGVFFVARIMGNRAFPGFSENVLASESDAVMAENADKNEEKPSLGHRLAEKADKIKYIVIALVVIALAGIALFNYQRRQTAAREMQAENKLYQSEIDLMSKPESDAIGMFSQLAKDYQGLPAGARSLVMKFGFAYNTRDYVAAEQAARDYLKEYPKSPMTSRVRLSLGQALRMQNKTNEAVTVFRELVSAAAPDILPEAKLALAQALESQAEESKDNPEEYKRRLEAAEAEFNDIIVRSQINVPGQSGFWPQAVVLPADFSLVVIKDKLAGYKHQSPRAAEQPAVTQSELESAAQVTTPPSDTPAEPAAKEEEKPEAPAAAKEPEKAAEPAEKEAAPAEAQK